MSISKKLSLVAGLALSVPNIFGVTKATDPVQKIIAAHKDKVVVVVFTKPGCPYCNKRRSIFNQLRDYANTNSKIEYFEVPAHSGNKEYLKRTYKFPTFPTIVLFKNGKQVMTYVGDAIVSSQIKNKINALVG